MYKTSVMLKNKSHNKNHIVSRVFDTINKMTDGFDKICESNEDIENNVSSTYNNYIVSLPNLKTPTKSKPFLICMYQVRTDGLYPFLLFLLKIDDNEANFIKMPEISGSFKKVKYAAVSYAKSILHETKISYAGFYELPTKNIIILNCNEQDIKIYTSTEYLWTTSFEIINKKKIGNTLMNNTIFDFFFENPSFLTLKTLDNRIYETPMIGYVKARDNVSNIEELDIYRETLLSELGKCYYLFIDIPYFREKHLMRIVFFAGEMVLYDEYDKNFDSMLCHNHRRYIIQNYNQHTVLSVLTRSDKIL
jgi:hypothetical protein